MRVVELIEHLQALDCPEEEVCVREGVGGPVRSIGATGSITVDDEKVVILLPLSEGLGTGQMAP